jgi:MFS family permease
MQDTGRARVLINSNYTLLWIARVVSTGGDYLFTAAGVVWIGLVLGRGQAWAPLAVSGALICASLPVVLLAPLAGVFADRWDRRTVMLAADAARIVLLLPVPLLLAAPLPAGVRLGLVYAVIAGLAAGDQFFRPAAAGLVAAIVPEDRRAQALGMLQAAFSLAMIAGPAVGAPLALQLGMTWAVLLNAVSFGVSFLAVRAIRPRAAAVADQTSGARGLLGDLAAGLRLLAGSRVLRTLMAASAIAMLGGSALNALDLFFVTHNLHTPGSWYGLLDAVFGLGAVAGAILTGIWGSRLGARRVVPLSLLSLGIAVMVYARLGAFAPAAVLVFGCGIPLAALQVAGGTLILEVTPQAMIGRITSLLDPITILASLAGTAIAGYLDGAVLRDFHARTLGVAFGPIDTIFLAAGALVLAGGAYALVGLRPEKPLVRARVAASPAAEGRV